MVEHTLSTITAAEMQGRKARDAGQNKVKSCPFDERAEPRLATAYFVGFDRRDRELRIIAEGGKL